MEFNGSWPLRLSPGRRRAVTRLVVLSHLTPCHEHGVTELVVFQRRVRPRTVACRRRRAERSAARLENMGGKEARERMMSKR